MPKITCLHKLRKRNRLGGPKCVVCEGLDALYIKASDMVAVVGERF